MVVFVGFAAAEEPITLTIYTGFDPSQEAVSKVFDRYIAKYEELHPNIKIHNLGKADDMDKVLTALMSETPPDLIKVNGDTLVQLYYEGFIQEVPEAIAAEARQVLFPTGIQGVTINGEMVGMPIENNTTAMLYNRQTLAEKGVANIPETWEELLELGRRISEYNDDGSLAVPAVITDGSGWSVAFMLWSMIIAEGGNLVENGKVAMSSPAVQRAVRKLLDALTNKPFLAFGGWNEFGSGQVPFALGYPWYRQAIISAQSDLSDFGSVPIPAGASGHGSVYYNHGYAVTTVSKHPKETWDFLSWLALEVQSDTGGTALGHVASTLGSLPMHRADMTASFYESQIDFLGGFVKALDFAAVQTGVMAQGIRWASIGYKFLDIINKGISPAQYINDCITELENGMAEWREKYGK